MPAKIVEKYEAIRKADPTRPVFLGLGQGVAWDGWYRPRRAHRITPRTTPSTSRDATSSRSTSTPWRTDNPQVKGKLDFVALGVERLVKWTDGRKIVWNTIECTRIESGHGKATPKQVKAEVWMSLVHGSRGIHVFRP